MTEPGWMYRTFLWTDTHELTFQAWVQSLADDGWQAWAPGMGGWATINQVRTYVLALRCETDNPWGTPPIAKRG